ncbi:MAG TPA: PilZ domain-containing protein [Kineosporiaceae bacterium]|nr:PilZ domain-containing protein [Kineosporiaceae bacterium]
MSRTTARPTPKPDLPGLNTLVRLTIGSADPPIAANVPSRVEDVSLADPRVKGSVTELFVAVPHYPGDVAVPRVGTACTVSWVGSDGVYDLPVGYLDRAVVGPGVHAWQVAVTGTAVRAQRRRFVRVSWAAPIVVDVVPVVRTRPDPGAGTPGPDPVDPPAGEAGPGDGSGPEGEEPTVAATLHGTTLDLSEGGVRCLLPPPQLRAGQPVRVNLEVEGELLHLDGTVVRSDRRAPVAGREPQCDTGIAFTEPDEHGDLLRRAVFSEQLRSRRAGIE